MKRRQETPSSPERKELEPKIESFRLDLRRLQLEHELLMKANELIKKDTAIDRQVLTNRKRPVVHADRGAHYRWPGWLLRIEEAKLIRSMSREGCSPDNAACEDCFDRLKTELFYPRNWQSTSIEQFIQTLDSCIRWYN